RKHKPGSTARFDQGPGLCEPRRDIQVTRRRRMWSLALHARDQDQRSSEIESRNGNGGYRSGLCHDRRVGRRFWSRPVWWLETEFEVHIRAVGRARTYYLGYSRLLLKPPAADRAANRGKRVRQSHLLV